MNRIIDFFIILTIYVYFFSSALKISSISAYYLFPFLIIIILKLSNRESQIILNRKKYMFYILFFLFFLIFSIVISDLPSDLAFKSILMQFIGLLIILNFLLISERKGILTKVMNSFSIIYISVIIMAIIEIFLNENVFNPDSSMYNYENIFGFKYPIAIFSNTNDLAQFLLLFTPIFFVNVSRIIKNKFFSPIIIFFLFLLISFILINTESRISYILFPVIFLIFFYLKFNNKLIKRLFLFLLFIMVGVYIIFFSNLFTLFDDDSSDIRILLLIAGFNLFLDNALLGVGAGGSIISIATYINDNRFNLGLPLHNMILKFLVEFGLLFSLIFVIFLIKICKDCIVISKREISDSYKLNLNYFICSLMLTFPFITTTSSDASIQPSTWLIFIPILVFIQQMYSNTKSID